MLLVKSVNGCSTQKTLLESVIFAIRVVTKGDRPINTDRKLAFSSLAFMRFARSINEDITIITFLTFLTDKSTIYEKT